MLLCACLNRIKEANQAVIDADALKRDTHRQIGHELANRRIAKKISLREVADRMCISSGYLSDLESSRGHWTEQLIRLYLAAIGK